MATPTLADLPGAIERVVAALEAQFAPKSEADLTRVADLERTNAALTARVEAAEADATQAAADLATARASIASLSEANKTQAADLARLVADHRNIERNAEVLAWLKVRRLGIEVPEPHQQ